uniref:Uncharacterized protein n=1 Tax=Panagrolaimus sp. JU765 TaxID=591449 RepID=A0AC34Q3M4_9BILA
MVQSPNFPKDLIDFPYIDDVKCDMTFTRSDGKDYGLYFIFTNGYTFGYNFSSPNGEIKQFEEKFDGQNANADDFEIYDSNSRIELYKAKTSISFGYGYGSDGHSGTTVRLWSAFQAFVYAPESVPTTNCWMNGQTFDLTDDKKIIPLFSQQIFNDYENCSWTVTVPLTMNMKLTIPKLFMPEGTVYQAKVIPDGGTPINVTEGMSREFSGYSFVIQFIASESAKEFNPDFIGFFGLVTAVFKANQSLEPLRFCRVNNETSTKSRLLSNDPNHGYNNNGICTASIPKEPNVAIVLQATYRFMEYLADKIEVFENDTESEEFSLELVNYDAHVYEGENDLSVKFLSDKNIVGAGFVVTWVQTPCECANETPMKTFIRIVKAWHADMKL